MTRSDHFDHGANEQRGGMSWEDITKAHPEMAEHEDTVNMLAHSHEGDRDAEGSNVGSLKFEHRNVPLSAVRNNQTGDRMRDPRTSEAFSGYQKSRYMDKEEQNHSVPPVLLVRRGARYEVADGHHRAEAAKMSASNTHINAVVARSPLKTRFPSE